MAAELASPWSERTGAFTATFVDPAVRSILYGIETILPSTTPVALVQSTDSGNTWPAIPATITPSNRQACAHVQRDAGAGRPIRLLSSCRPPKVPCGKLR